VRVVGREVDIGGAELEESLYARGDRYNEWVVRDFKVVGVFIAEPATTWGEVPVPMPGDWPPQLVLQDVSISVLQVAEEFKELPIYSLFEREILQWKASAWRPIAHSDIYCAVKATPQN